MRVIDLSHPIGNGAPVYPGDPPVELTPAFSPPQDAFTLYRLHAGLHTGTHIDAPMHMTPDTRFIGEFPLDCFWGKGVVLDVAGQQTIKVEGKDLDRIKEGDIVLLYTGCGHLYASDPQAYFADHPVVCYELAQRLAEKKIKMLGMDLPAPDKPPFTVHTLLLSQGVFLLENLVNLEALRQEPHLYVAAFPLRIRAEASLTRAIAVIP